jgi:hypothetical protein
MPTSTSGLDSGCLGELSVPAAAVTGVTCMPSVCRRVCVSVGRGLVCGVSQPGERQQQTRAVSG